MRRISSYSLAGASRQLAAPHIPPLHVHDTLLNSGTTVAYLEDLMQRWAADSASVAPEWDAFFKNAAERSTDEPLQAAPTYRLSPGVTTTKQSLADCARLVWMIQAFETRGYIKAACDPLHEYQDLLQRTPLQRFTRENLQLDLEFFGFSPEDQGRIVNVALNDDLGGIFTRADSTMTIGELHTRLQQLYCSTKGYEYSHMRSPTQIFDLREHVTNSPKLVDNPLFHEYTPTECESLLKQLADVVFFEDVLQRKMGQKKRFGIEGGDSMVLGLNALLEESVKLGVEAVVCGMPHRGRLNCLVNVFEKPLAAVLKEFQGLVQSDFGGLRHMQGDVAYHLGSHGTRRIGDKDVYVELLNNPSHLELVNPVVHGVVKALQDQRGDSKGKKVLPIEIHGDASIAGEGVVYETMGLCEVEGCHTGGCIHVINNNQVGFTTDPIFSRSTTQCSDIGRGFNCPIFHVNADHPEDVVSVFRYAARFREKFRKSVVINFISYRRYGHNEVDDPSITQPGLYRKIATHPNVFKLYAEKLREKGFVTAQTIAAIEEAAKAKYNAAYAEAATFDYGGYLAKKVANATRIPDISRGSPPKMPNDTSITSEVVKSIADVLVIPEDANPDPKLARILAARVNALRTGRGIEWGDAEMLAFGSLLLEGYGVHILGEDVERGTFAHRHAVVHNRTTNKTLTPMEKLQTGRATFTVRNSTLSEVGVLGYEMGYSQASPNTLCAWEAQFGDFANVAQPIFDQFLSASESKWGDRCGLFVLMPHGQDGAGPEHSSGRIERFLQSCNEPEELSLGLSIDERHARCNWEVIYPTTPAQLFHLFRRAMHRNFRKPTVVFVSKRYLRAQRDVPNVSAAEDFTAAGTFRTVLPDVEGTVEAATRLVLCTGQMFYKLFAARAETKVKGVYLLRIEQLSPFPIDEVMEAVRAFKGEDIVWAQEEPENMGAFAHVEARLRFFLERPLIYAGRPPSAAPATGFKHLYDHEERDVIAASLGTPSSS